MDFIQESSNARIYEKCKRIVKFWEQNFRKKHGRIPSKLDIKEASSDIRQAYRTYFNLKTRLLEQSLIDLVDPETFDFSEEIENKDTSNKPEATITSNPLEIESKDTSSNLEITITNNLEKIENKNTSNKPETTITNNPPETINAKTAEETKEAASKMDVWGNHLNRNFQSEKSAAKKLNLSVSLSQKSFIKSGSGFAKRNPRKSLKKDKSASLLTCSQPVMRTSSEISSELDLGNSQNSLVTEFNQCSLPPIVSKSEESLSINKETVNIVRSMIDIDGPIVRRKVDSNWMDRVSKTLNEDNDFVNLSHNTNDSDSDSIIENSDVEEEEHASKKIRFTVSLSQGNKQYSGSLFRHFSEPICKYDEVKIDSAKINNKLLAACQEQDLLDSKTNNLDCNIDPLDFKSNYLNSKTGNADFSNKTEAKQDNTSNLITSPNLVAENKVNDASKVEKWLKTVNTINKNAFDSQTTNVDLSDKVKAIKNSARNLNGTSDVPMKIDETVQIVNKIPLDEYEFNLSNNSIELNLNAQNNAKEIPTKIKKNSNKGKSKETKKKNGDIVKKVKVGLKRLKKSEKIINQKEDGNIPRPYSNNDEENQGPCFRMKKKVLSTNLKVTNLTNEEKLQLKIKNGALNDNFVRINIEKKKYSRGKKSFNFSKHKKTLWKSKKKELAQQHSGCDGGAFKCFTCGNSGHFASQCPVVQDDGLLPLDVEYDKINKLATLEDASKEPKQDTTRQNNILLDTPQISTEENTEEIDLTTNKDMEPNISEVNMGDSNLLTTVNPIYELKDDGSLIDTPKEVFDVLKEVFGHDRFRSGQEQTIMRILSGQSTLLTLTTGSGKSLCYQLPAYLYSKYRSPCVALVVSPLVSLMADQVSRSKRTACLNSTMSMSARNKIVELLKEGMLDSLLVSPEAIVNGINYLVRILPPISFICIDEVHCISQWSHNFRPSYLMLCKILRSKLKATVMLGLTATASKEVQSNIVKHLNISQNNSKSDWPVDTAVSSDYCSGIIGEVIIPENLLLNASKEENKDLSLIRLLNSEQFENFNSIIVYCTRQQECERLATRLRTTVKAAGNQVDESSSRKRKRESWVAEAYHAGFSASKRNAIQKRFMTGELRIVVATVAFGMGINKSDIRAVIHYNMPKTFESYVQEIGRAGRDGQLAYCHVFLDKLGSDKKELKRHIYSNSVDRYIIRKLLQKVFKKCDCLAGTCQRHEVTFNVDETIDHLNISEVTITTLLCYLELCESKSYIEVLNLTYNRCRIISYQGVDVLIKCAKENKFLEEAIKLVEKESRNQVMSNIIEFSVTDIARKLNCESSLVKQRLRNLEWTTVNGNAKRTSLKVEFHGLAFSVRANGDLSEEELDNALNYLYNRVIDKENTELQLLEHVYDTFGNFSVPNSSHDNDTLIRSSVALKDIVLKYFNSTDKFAKITRTNSKDCEINDTLLTSNAQSLLSIYKENNFTGRDVANIFYGISSPNFPAAMWGKCKFWRKFVGEDYHRISRLASNVILSLRR